MPVVVHILLHLGGLILGDALRALFAVEETLEKVIRAPRGRTGRIGFEKLLAQGPAAQTVDGLHLMQQGLSRFEEPVQVGFHGRIASK